MKKILFIMLIFGLQYNISAQCFDFYIETPNNGNIKACSGGGYSPSQVQQADAYSRTFALTVYEAGTSYYNCHGYTWHVSEGGSKVWINNFLNQANNLNTYWDDGSYYPYSHSSQTHVENLKVFYGSYSSSSDHSAITTADPNIFISKMGAGCLVSHYKNNSPYDASSLTYYRRTPQIIGLDFIGASCSATYSITPPSGATNFSWQATGGAGSGVTPYSATGTTSFTTSRTNDLFAPEYAAIQFSFAYDNKQYTVTKTIASRIIPFLAGIFTTGGMPADYLVSGQPYYFKADIPAGHPFVLDYEWEIVINGVTYRHYGEITPLPTVFINPGTYPVRIRVRDGCGWNRWFSTTVDVH